MLSKNIGKGENSASRINNRYLQAEFTNFPEITNEIRAKNSSRIFTGGVRINNSMYRTNKESEGYILKSLERKLP